VIIESFPVCDLADFNLINRQDNFPNPLSTVSFSLSLFIICILVDGHASPLPNRFQAPSGYLPLLIGKFFPDDIISSGISRNVVWSHHGWGHSLNQRPWQINKPCLCVLTTHTQVRTKVCIQPPTPTPLFTAHKCTVERGGGVLLVANVISNAPSFSNNVQIRRRVQKIEVRVWGELMEQKCF